MIKEALSSLFRKPNTKRSFTKANEFVAVPENYRGKIQFQPDLCIGCLLCIRTCPTGAITAGENRKVNIQLDKCIFCGQCKETCPKTAISFTSDFIIISTSRQDFNTPFKKVGI